MVKVLMQKHALLPELSIVCLQCGLAVFRPWKCGTVACPSAPVLLLIQ